uniref:Uncharacterized protein n=1 Tax=Panagrolaimus sp. PS1159 TaxID=55785 RepID=A0AC35GR81_9BILA
MSHYSSNSRRRYRDEPTSSDRRPYGFFPYLNDNSYGYEEDRSSAPYDDEEEEVDDYPPRDSYRAKEYRGRNQYDNDRYEDDDRHYSRRGYDDDVDRHYSRRGYDDDDDHYYGEQEGGNFLTQIFWFIYTLFTSPLTILARAGLWLISTIFMFTPLYPVYLLFKKGTGIFRPIGNFVGFFKDILAIIYNCVTDVSNNRGYMSNKLPSDIKQAFSKLMGYEAGYDDDYRVRGDGLKKRAFNAAAYAASGGHYPKNLSGHGVSPRHRYGQQGSGGGIVSLISSIGGMIYYILTGQFLFNNNMEPLSPSATPRQRRRYEEQQKKSYMRGILGFVVIVLVLWWLFASGNLERIIRGIFGKILSIAASIAFWIIKKSFYLLFWIPSLFFRSNQGYPTPSPNADTNFGQYVSDMPEYVTNATSGVWNYFAENLFHGLNATATLNEIKNSPADIGNILYRQFTRSLRWSISQLISGCFHANVCH